MPTLFKATVFVTALWLSAPVAFVAPAYAQGFGHTFIMRGSVVEVTGRVVTACIGRADGAQVGQTLSVVRISSIGAAGRPLSFRRQDIGSLTISTIVDDHFAQAAAVSGRITKNDLVEFRRNQG